ncbi:MAG: PASTA domain-containing protein [Spirochaetota bacterium]
MFNSFLKKINRLLPNSYDDSEIRYFKIIVYISLGIIIFMVTVGLITFFLSLKGQELTMVPDIRGLALENGLIALQEKELNPRIQLRFSTPTDKGTILSQDPGAGTLVKVGSRVTMKVSKGAIVDKVENYIGWKISDLEIHLQTLFTTYGPLLRIKRPLIRVYNDAPAGTILQQKPLPGTALSGLTDLELVVSRGPKGQMLTVENFLQKDFQAVIETLAKTNTPFIFTVRDTEGKEKPGLVVSQTPEEGDIVPVSTIIQLIMTKPKKIPEGYVFGVLQKSLPDYPVAVDLKLEAVSLEGDKKTILTMKHSGGLITIPYIEEENTILILSVFDKEIVRYTVRPSA